MTDTPEPYDSTNATLDHIARVRELLSLCVADLVERGRVHDASKLLPPEKDAFDRGTPALRGLTYGSPEYKDAFHRYGMREAVDHHYAENRHHPEYFATNAMGLCDPAAVRDGTAVSRMTLFDLVEMLMDWKAASERMKDGGDIAESLRVNVDRFGLSPQLASVLANTIREMGWTA